MAAQALQPLDETFLPGLWVAKADVCAKGRSLLFSSHIYLAWDEGETSEVMKRKAPKKLKGAQAGLDHQMHRGAKIIL